MMEHLMRSMNFHAFAFVQPLPPPLPSEKCMFLSNGAASLNLTNADILSKQQGIPGATLILEDDVMVSSQHMGQKDLGAFVQDIIKEVPQDWDMIYFEYCFESCVLTSQVSKSLQKAYSPSCAAAILYNNASIGKIVPLITDSVMGKCRPHDNVYSVNILLGNINAYSLVNPLFYQDAYYGSNLSNGNVHDGITKTKHVQRVASCYGTKWYIVNLTGLLLLLVIVTGIYIAWTRIRKM
jgi:hypothetical protein